MGVRLETIDKINANLEQKTPVIVTEMANATYKGSPGAPGLPGPPGPKGEPGIYVGSAEPTDDDILVWINPSGSPTEGLATIEYVDEAIKGVEAPEIDLTGYATEDYVDEAIESIDLEDYATKEYVDETIANIDIPESEIGPKLDIYTLNSNLITYAISEEDKAILEEIYARVSNGDYNFVVGSIRYPRNYKYTRFEIIYNELYLYRLHLDTEYYYQLAFDTNGVLTTTKWIGEKANKLNPYNIPLDVAYSPSGANTNVAEAFKYIRDNYQTEAQVNALITAAIGNITNGNEVAY